MNKEKTLVFSIALKGYSQLFKNCISSQRKYCEKHGMDYVLVDKSPRQLLPIEAAWLKLFLLREALYTNKYNWIAFIDADCEIRDFSPSFILDLVKYDPSKSIFLAKGFSGRINSGVIILKNTSEALLYLNNVINNGDLPVPKEDEALYENGHMIHFGKSNPAVQIMEWEEWNNNHDINKNSFIQHYSGGILREQYLKRYPIRTWSNKTIKRFKRYFFIFSDLPQITSMQHIGSLIPFYLKNHTEFNKKN